MADLLVKLYDNLDFNTYDEIMSSQDVAIKKACITDKNLILDFVEKNFRNESIWRSECEYALFNNPISCHIAVKNKKIIGFACYDATTRGFFGPTGVTETERGKGIGTALLLKSLASMKEMGYAYAIIGWTSNAINFYIKQVNAVEIPDSPPQKSIYKNMTAFN